MKALLFSNFFRGQRYHKNAKGDRFVMFSSSACLTGLKISGLLFLFKKIFTTFAARF